MYLMCPALATSLHMVRISIVSHFRQSTQKGSSGHSAPLWLMTPLYLTLKEHPWEEFMDISPVAPGPSSSVSIGLCVLCNQEVAQLDSRLMWLTSRVYNCPYECLSLEIGWRSLCKNRLEIFMQKFSVRVAAFSLSRFLCTL